MQWVSPVMEDGNKRKRIFIEIGLYCGLIHRFLLALERLGWGEEDRCRFGQNQQNNHQTMEKKLKHSIDTKWDCLEQKKGTKRTRKPIETKISRAWSEVLRFCPFFVQLRSSWRWRQDSRTIIDHISGLPIFQVRKKIWTYFVDVF